MIPPVVDAAFLDAHPDAVIADVRWYLDGRDGFAGFLAGHLPGARWVDLDHQLSATGVPATEGRHPLPTPEAFAAAMSTLGIGDDTTVVAYDDAGGAIAGRMVVMLRMLGHDAALLDGGLRSWTEPPRDGALETGAGEPPPGAEFTAKPWPANRLADAETAGQAAAHGAMPVMDARSSERFAGHPAAVDTRHLRSRTAGRASAPAST